MAHRSSLRASDTDRDQVTERLRRAAADGRILAAELEERLATALRARTYGELDSVIADLPGGRVAHGSRPRRTVPGPPVVKVTLVLVVSMVALILAAVVLAGLVALSSVWLLFAVVWIARGGGRGRRLPGSRYAPHRNLPSRW